VFSVSSTRPSGAVSVSAPVSRTPLATLVAEAAAIRATVAAR